VKREIEVKILDINVEEVKTKLHQLNAKYEDDTLQKIYTYDVFPIFPTYLSLIQILKNKLRNKETVLATQRLVALLSDLSDLLTVEHQRELVLLTNTPTFQTFINSISVNNVPEIIFSEDFKTLISNYYTNPNKWVRLRESNGKVTIALKQIYNRKITNGVRHHALGDVKEIEISIDNLANGKLLLEELGYFHKNYQEKKRCSFSLPGNIRIDIDMWPRIPPYLEIEANNQETIFSVLKQLGFRKEDAKSLNTDDVYTLYGLDMYSYKELKFDS
jgi:adenylate cyclase class 2